MRNSLFILIILIFHSGCSYAQPVETVNAIDIPSDRILTPEEQVIVKEEIKTKIFDRLTPAKNDYVNEFDRGTVFFNPEKGNKFDPEALKIRNYSFHKVIFPDGAIVKDLNFTQKEPHTVAIEGKNLTFVNCNLNNIEIDKSWNLIGSSNFQVKWYEETINGRIYRVQELEVNGQFIENDRMDVTPPIIKPQ